MKLKNHILALAGLLSLPAGAVTSFVEDFDTDSSNWRDTTGTLSVNWSESGGAPGASPGHASVPFSFTQAGNFGAVILRGQAPFGSSGGAFTGDWLADGVQSFSAMVRHDAPVPLTFNLRFATPFNFPGASAVRFQPVFPGQWTEISVDIATAAATAAFQPPGPPIGAGPGVSFVTTEGQPFSSIFSNVGNIQVGVSVPDGFENNPAFFNFDLDQVTLTVPEPASSSLVLLSSFLLLGIRRRSS